MYLLANRNFRGNLKIDPKARVIEIQVRNSGLFGAALSVTKTNVQVQPDIHEKNEHGRATKTLSGGEKSFSTICLLLAIWEAMGSSIRCLDELSVAGCSYSRKALTRASDVFMDNVNREISMKMMVIRSQSPTSVLANATCRFLQRGNPLVVNLS